MRAKHSPSKSDPSKISQGRSHDKHSTFRLKGAAACLLLLLMEVNDVSNESGGAHVDPSQRWASWTSHTPWPLRQPERGS